MLSPSDLPGDHPDRLKELKSDDASIPGADSSVAAPSPFSSSMTATGHSAAGHRLSGIPENEGVGAEGKV